MASLLTVNNLKVQFASRKLRHRVDDFSLTINAGECVGLVGESGCGKTTTGLGNHAPAARHGKIAAGNIVLDDVDLASLSEKEMQRQRGQSIALIPGSHEFTQPTTKIGRQIGEGLRIHHGASDADARKRALEVLEMVEMPRPAERLNQYPFELSGGLRQRVIIAMAWCAARPFSSPRADDGPGRDDSGADPRHSGQPEERTWHGDAAHHHDMGVIAGRTDRVVVMYAARSRRGRDAGDLPFDASSLHSGAPGVDAQPGERLEAQAGVHRRHAARPDQGDRGVPLRAACSFATDQCRSEEPPITLVGGHAFACFHPLMAPNRLY